jgi:hypothetical protein
MPLARSEVAATAFRGGVAVIGGFLPGCAPTKAVELYQPVRSAPDAVTIGRNVVGVAL